MVMSSSSSSSSSLSEDGGGGRAAITLPRLRNPFTLRVGQVFTGFGIGCGIGIGVGQPFNLRAVPVLGEAAGGAVNSLGSLSHHFQNLIKKIGIKNVQAGVGCGVGLGHGFGVGLALKPGAAQQLKHAIDQCIHAVNERVKSASINSSNEESNAESPSLPSGTAEALEVTTFQKTDAPLQTEKMLEGFLQIPPTKGTGKSPSGQLSEVERLQTENKILRTLLTHQEQIEDLKKQNTALRQALAADTDSSVTSASEAPKQDKTTHECFECKMRSRQKRPK